MQSSFLTHIVNHEKVFFYKHFMIFYQSFKREFTQTAIGVFLALLSITMTVYLAQLLNRAAGGRIESETVGPTLAFMVLNFVPTLLTLTLFIAILTVLTRCYRDSEMIIWQTAGMPLTGFIRPVLQFSLPIVIIIALMSLFLTPFSNQQNIKYQEIMRQKSDVSRLSPGVFRESQTNNRVFFVESFDEESQVIHNIFVHSSTEDNALRVITANLAEVQNADSGQRFIALKEGRAYQGTPGMADFSIMNFDRYLIATGMADVNERDLPTRAKPTAELVENQNSKNLNELLWRLNIPLVALGLSLMAIPLSVYNPRTHQSANIIFALLTFLMYTNLLNLARSMLSDGKISFMTATVMVHVCAALIVILFFYLGKLHRWIFK